VIVSVQGSFDGGKAGGIYVFDRNAGRITLQYPFANH
jgi:hypothetical protein